MRTTVTPVLLGRWEGESVLGRWRIAGAEPATLDFGDVHPGTQPHISRSRHRCRKGSPAARGQGARALRAVGQGVVGRQFARQELQPIMGHFERRGAMAWRSRLVDEPGSRKPAGGT